MSILARPFALAPPLVAALLLVAAPAQERPGGTSDVVDSAGMFSEGAVRQARRELARLDRAHGVTVRVVTVESLKGEGLDEVANRRAEQLDHPAILVLVAKQERKIEAVAAPRSLRDELGQSRLHAIRDAFAEEFRKRQVDEGLARGVEAAATALASVRPAKAREDATTPAVGTFNEATAAKDSPLVLRQQIRLTLAGARKAVAASEAKAGERGYKMNVAVVDDGGHLIAFARMDGARAASVATSTTKAVSAATYRAPTGPLPVPGGKEPDLLLNVGLQNAASDSGGKITSLLGGLPIVVDGQVLGAIGVGGGSGEQDLEVARAGLAAFHAALQAPAEPSAAKPEAESAKPKAEAPAPAAHPEDKPKEDKPKAEGADTSPR